MTEPARTAGEAPEPPRADRRAFLGAAATLTMAGGLAASYGVFAAFAGRFLYPARPRPTGWLFVCRVADLGPGGSMVWRAPDGSAVAVARKGSGSAPEDFVALSTTCPHLGCQVHWQAAQERFFCPCHNGVFSPEGKAISGPPADGGQNLPRYPLKIDNGLLYLEVPLETLGAGPPAGPFAV